MADTTPEEAPEKKTGSSSEATEIPAEPTDDIVTTQHTLTVKRKKLAYTAKAGRIVLRKEVVKDGKSDGLQGRRPRCSSPRTRSTTPSPARGR